ncbi:MAG: hypothetical protein ACC683_13410, partial [Acidimicrobiia bacterium]
MRTAIRSFVFVAALLAVTFGGYASAGAVEPSEETARTVAAEAPELKEVFAAHPDTELNGETPVSEGSEGADDEDRSRTLVEL